MKQSSAKRGSESVGLEALFTTVRRLFPRQPSVVSPFA